MLISYQTLSSLSDVSGCKPEESPQVSLTQSTGEKASPGACLGAPDVSLAISSIPKTQRVFPAWRNTLSSVGASRSPIPLIVID